MSSARSAMIYRGSAHRSSANASLFLKLLAGRLIEEVILKVSSTKAAVLLASNLLLIAH